MKFLRIIIAERGSGLQVYLSLIHPFCPLRLIEPINLEKAVDLYQKAAGVFEVNLWIELAFF